MINNEKPKVRLVGQDGNIFNLVGIASKALKSCDQHDKVDNMRDRVFAAQSYHEALSIILEYADEAGDDLAYDEEDDLYDNEFSTYDDYDDDNDDYFYYEDDEDDDDEIVD